MPDLRSRRRNRTAETIRKAAVDLALSDGLDNITTEMIAERAGISLRSFFNYFSFKEEALLPEPITLSDDTVTAFVAGKGALLDDLADLLATHFRQANPDRRQLRAIIELSQAHPKLTLVKDQTFCRYEDKICEIIARRLGVAAGDIRPKLMAAVVTAAIRTGVTRWTGCSDDSPVEHEVRAALSALRTLFQEGAEGASPRLRGL